MDKISTTSSTSAVTPVSDTGKRPSLWSKLRNRPLAMGTLSVLLGLYLIALFAPFLAPNSPLRQNLHRTFQPPVLPTWYDGALQVPVYQMTDLNTVTYEQVPDQYQRLRWFVRGHEYKLFGFIPANVHLFGVEGTEPYYPLGSDDIGRCVFSRLLYGSQISLSIGILGISITMTIGFLYGAFSGYLGGLSDSIMMRFIEFLMSVPTLYLLLALRSALVDHFSSDQMFLMVTLILSFLGWMGTARIIRGMTLSVRQRSYVMASETMGQNVFQILRLHILPNVFSYLLVAATLSVPGYILGEAALSFLGLGITDPSVSWGQMLAQAQNPKVFAFNFWWVLTPGVAIFITVMAYNILGDVLRDLVDPKIRL
jgi:peptide/nickel transport system permease protein